MSRYLKERLFLRRLPSKFSSYFILRSEKAMQLLSLMTSFLLFIRASLVKTNQHQQQHQSNKTKQIGSRKWHFD